MEAFPFDSELTFDDHDNPIYDRAVSSQPLRELIRGLFSTGVMPNPSTNLQVSAGTDGMTVQVAAGFAVVDGGLCKEKDTRTLEVTASDNTYDRIDTVVVRWNENVDVRTADLYVVAGTPAVNPVRPTLQRNNSIYEIGLADVFITKRVATITNDKITDTRYDSARCGIVSSVSEWDTTTIYQQIQADLAGFKTNEQAGFESWFDTIRGILDSDTAGHLQNEIDNIRKHTITNMLKPTLATSTVGGVTCTNNGDGTYTINGTSTDWAVFDLNCSVNLKAGVEYRLTGCPTGGSGSTYRIGIYNESLPTTQQFVAQDLGSGITFTVAEDGIFDIHIPISPNVTVENLLFKPMLTTDTIATYGDFVPYSGGGNLNEDVADLFQLMPNISYNGNRVKNISFVLEGNTLNITTS